MATQTDPQSAPAELDRAAATADRGARDTRLLPALEAIESGSFRVLSLDIFDTLLVRRVVEPVDVFTLVGRRLAAQGRLAPELGPSDFGRLRIVAEERARVERRLRDGALEVTLPEIFAMLPPWATHGLTVDELAGIEVDVERGVLFPDLDVLALAEAAHARGMLVVAVSDTYFSASDLRSFLARPPASPGMPERLFLSNEHGVGKASGLFPIVLRELGVAPEQVVHVGDNPGADLHPPTRLGMRAVLYERRTEALDDALEREEAGGGDDLGLTALRARALRLAEREAQDARLRPFWDYGAAHLGPVLTGFAEWIHAGARSRGATRVHCLMREGHLLAEMVDAAAPYLGSEVEARKLWLSRQVCGRAALKDGSVEELRALLQRMRLPTVRELCATLALDLAADLPAFVDRADSRLDDAGLADEIFEAIAMDQELRSRIAAESRALRRRIIRYLREELPPGARQLVIVDLGWGGTIQALLERALRLEGEDLAVVGLYLVTAQRAEQRLFDDGLEMHGYLGRNGRPAWAVNAIMRSPEVLEQACMPDHGSQTDLGEDLRPVLGGEENAALQSAERGAVQHGVLAFQRLWGRYAGVFPGAMPDLAARRAQRRLRRILVRAVLAPTADEAVVFSQWLHDEGFGSDGVASIVAGHAAAAVPYLDPAGMANLPMTDVYWPFALAAIHDPPLARGMDLAVRGHADPDVFSAPLDTGAPELYADLGWGFTPQGMVRLPDVRRSRHGRSLVRADLKGDFVRRVRFDPADRPSIARIDWLRIRCWLHGRPDPVTLRLHTDQEIAALESRGADRVAARVLLAQGDDPQLIVDLARLLPDAQVWKAEVEIAFATIGLTPDRRETRRQRRRRRAVAWAKQSPVAAPVRAARRVLLRAGR